MNEITLVAETAFSHEGDLDYLLKQVEDAAKGGADAVKFQILLKPEQYFAPGHPSIARIADMVFNSQEWDEVINLAVSSGLQVIVLPLENAAFSYCLERIPRIKAVELHSVCFHDFHLRQLLRKWPGTKIIGIGGRQLSEVMELLKVLSSDNSAIVLMAGFQSFPTMITDLELAKLAHFAAETGCTMGYADHTAHDDSAFHQLNTVAYFLGARWFEKHLVVSREESRTDYESAVDWPEFQRIKEHFQELFACLGEGDAEKLNEREVVYRDREKCLVTVAPLASGDIFSWTNLALRVLPQKGGLSGRHLSEIVGCRSVRAIKSGEMVGFEDIK